MGRAMPEHTAPTAESPRALLRRFAQGERSAAVLSWWTAGAACWLACEGRAGLLACLGALAQSPLRRHKENTVSPDFTPPPDSPALRLVDGRVFALPPVADVAEYRLPGNFRQWPEADLVGCYDESTATGALLFCAVSFWNVSHPIARADFWARCEVAAQTLAASQAPRDACGPVGNARPC